MRIVAKLEVTKGSFVLDVNLDEEINGVLGVFGHSGAGKTTLLRAFAGLEETNAATITVGEEQWNHGNASIPAHRRRIGYVFQESMLFEHLNVRENILFGMKRFPNSLDQDEAFGIAGITELLERNVSSLSGGERQRVAIARAIAIRPKILLLDEPFASLDQDSKNEIFPFINELRERIECPIIYVTHNLSEISRFTDQLLLIENGSVRGFGITESLLTDTGLPFHRFDDSESFVTTTCVGYDKEFGINELRFADSSLFVPGKEYAAGTAHRVRIAASDVSIALSKPSATSIQNVLEGIVSEIVEIDGKRAVVKIEIRGSAILSRITLKSLSELDLKPGSRVFAQIKSVAIQD